MTSSSETPVLSSPDSYSSVNVLSSSPPYPPSTPSRYSNRIQAGPDYSQWTESRWARFPGYQLAYDPHRQRAWWWPHGYRLKKRDGHGESAYRWVCCICMTRLRPPLRTGEYSYDASTGRSIEAHLRKKHQISKDRTQHTSSRRSGGQITIEEAARLDTNNPQQQQLLMKLQELFDAGDSQLFLMDWIVINNLPFRVVESEEFRRFVTSINPACWIPSRKVITNLIKNEYQYAISDPAEPFSLATGPPPITITLACACDFATP
jgi:hypothetical protein